MSEAPVQQSESPPETAPAAEVKRKPAPAPAPQFNVVKAGYVQRQGLLFKNWNQLWMTLDEDGVSLRWYKTEQRTGNDGTLYMSKCADVCDPREGVTTNWPENTDGRCFVVCSPHRAHYIVAESVEEKNDWVAKLTEAKKKFNTAGVGIVSVDLFSIEALKVSISSEIERAQGETDRALESEGTSTEQIGKSLDKTVKDAEKELQKDQTVQQAAVVTEQTAQQVETEVKIEAASDTVEVGVTVETATSGEGDGEGGGETAVEVEAAAQEETAQETAEETAQETAEEKQEETVQETAEEKQEECPAEDGKEE